MDKQVQFFGKTASGVYCQSLFGNAGAFEKTAGAPPFADWATGDALRKYIATLTQEDRKRSVYVLVNALGAGEYFGSNINADYFPWNALTHEGTDYGYKTFEHFAHAYQHHKNKDPTKAFGVPVLSVLNIPMKRVELIVRLDRAKAKEEQADGIITRIEAGEFPDVSMGCKVPYDICSICANKSKTRDDYCQHMHPPADLRGVYGPNKILLDGRKIYVINTLPKFFDISFVFIGADKTAKVMAKVASKNGQTCLGDVCAMPQYMSKSAAVLPKIKSPQEIAKGYSEVILKAVAKDKAACCDDCDDNNKLAEAFKVSEIVKTVPANDFVKNLESREQNLPTATLNTLAQNHSVGEITGGCAALGIVLKPAEFQRIILIRMGDHGFADHLDREGATFRPVPAVNKSINPDPTLLGPGMLQLLRQFIGVRSGLGEPLHSRILKTAEMAKIPLPTPTALEHPMLDKISAAYNGYRQNLLTKFSQVEKVIYSDPSLRDEILGTSLTGMFSKTAHSEILSSNSVAYMMSAYITDKNLPLTSVAAKAVAEFSPEV